MECCGFEFEKISPMKSESRMRDPKVQLDENGSELLPYFCMDKAGSRKE